MSVKIHFCSSNLPLALVIKATTFSQWSHVAFEIDGIVYESVGGGGVRMITPEQLFSHQPVVRTVEVDVPHPEKMVEFSRSQVGKGYDYVAIVALPFRRNWGHPDRWFCSEFATAALLAGGYEFNSLPPWRVTPKDLWVKLG